MSNKVVKLPQPKPQKPQAPGLDSPILKDVSKEQASYIQSYPPLLGKLLQKLWVKFGKGPFNIDAAAKLEDQLISECDRFIMDKFQGLLGLQEYIMVIGALAGLQFGYGAAKGMVLTSENYRGAGQLFEASMRIMAESSYRHYSGKLPPAKH